MCPPGNRHGRRVCCGLGGGSHTQPDAALDSVRRIRTAAAGTPDRAALSGSAVRRGANVVGAHTGAARGRTAGHIGAAHTRPGRCEEGSRRPHATGFVHVQRQRQPFTPQSGLWLHAPLPGLRLSSRLRVCVCVCARRWTTLRLTFQTPCQRSQTISARAWSSTATCPARIHRLLREATSACGSETCVHGVACLRSVTATREPVLMMCGCVWLFVAAWLCVAVYFCVFTAAAK